MTFAAFGYSLISRSCRCSSRVYNNFLNFLWKFSIADYLPDKKIAFSLVLDAMDKLPLSLMVKATFPLSRVVELESLVGVAALVGTKSGLLTKEYS